MAKTNRNGNTYYRFLKSQGLNFKDQDQHPIQPETKPLDQNCNYPLFKLEQIAPGVLRRRAIVRG